MRRAVRCVLYCREAAQDDKLYNKYRFFYIFLLARLII